MSDAQPREWLETDGLGGFAMGTVQGPRTRRYHGFLTVALKPPTHRFNLVPGMEVWAEIAGERFLLTPQLYAPDFLAADSRISLEQFAPRPWPQWRFRLPGGVVIEHEIIMRHGHPTTLLAWRAKGKPAEIKLLVRPLLAARDYHSLHHENPNFKMSANAKSGRLDFAPYENGPTLSILASAPFHSDPVWYRNFLYAEERARGQDHIEDLAAPGVFEFDLSRSEAVLLLSAEPIEDLATAALAAASIRRAEQKRRSAFATPLHQSADNYLVRRGEGKTIIAGYPWFADWGRDTFIALRGLCIATGNFTAARDILLDWASAVSEGMLPNRFPDSGEAPEYNSVDASLWYIIAIHDLFKSAPENILTPRHRATLQSAVTKILEGYAAGTRFGIRMDTDGLLACGERGVQLTWMDAKIGSWVVTPRIGKPVEIQALWLSALHFASSLDPKWRTPLALGSESFRKKFWNDACGYLNDVVDVDHQLGRVDATLRPNQLLAVGGLPLQLIAGNQAESVVAAAEQHLLTPMGLRTLPPADRAYIARYEGAAEKRDAAYHQGTVWPWLIGAFVDAWLNVHGRIAENAAVAREKFLSPLLKHLEEAGLVHVSEIADADAPHTPRGCPFQAWSVGELLRIELELSNLISKREMASAFV